jgi:hypothetical protein
MRSWGIVDANVLRLASVILRGAIGVVTLTSRERSMVLIRRDPLGRPRQWSCMTWLVASTLRGSACRRPSRGFPKHFRPADECRKLMAIYGLRNVMVIGEERHGLPPRNVLLLTLGAQAGTKSRCCPCSMHET